jgi:hypothetical protein
MDQIRRRLASRVGNGTLRLLKEKVGDGHNVMTSPFQQMAHRSPDLACPKYGEALLCL